jgi:hypothetical protein
MRIVLNTSILIAGFKKPLPQGAIVTAVDELEAAQLVQIGYVSETDKKATHDNLSIKAEAAAKTGEDEGETPEGEKPVVTTESAGAKGAANSNKRR